MLFVNLNLFEVQIRKFCWKQLCIHKFEWQILSLGSVQVDSTCAKHTPRSSAHPTHNEIHPFFAGLKCLSLQQLPPTHHPSYMYKKPPQNWICLFSNRKYIYGGCWAHYGKENSGKHNNRFPTRRHFEVSMNSCEDISKIDVWQNSTWHTRKETCCFKWSRQESMWASKSLPRCMSLKKIMYFHGQQNLPSNVALTINGREA